MPVVPNNRTATKIETLEDRFRHLHELTLLELNAGMIDMVRLLNNLTLLPIQLRKEYEKAIQAIVLY